MSDFPETNYSLISRVKDLGDGASWVEFLGIYQPVFYRMAKRRGLQDADANDVVQQVFVSIAGSIEGWNRGANLPPFRAWLTTIARNAITKALTRRPRDQASGSTSAFEVIKAQPAGSDTDQTTVEMRKEARQEIVHWAAQKIQGEFSAATWDVFLRTSIHGESVANVAGSTGRSAGSIYVARHRVIARLKEEVATISQHWEVPS